MNLLLLLFILIIFATIFQFKYYSNYEHIVIKSIILYIQFNIEEKKTNLTVFII